MSNELRHYGILRKSGRYPWGSGGTTLSRSRRFVDIVGDLRNQGLKEVDIARGFGMTTTELRDLNSLARNQIKQADIAMATRLKDKGYSTSAIARRMDKNESSVRLLLAPGAKDKADQLTAIATMLKKEIEEKGVIDVGLGVANQLQITENRLKTALTQLKSEGYTVTKVQIDQLGTKNKTLTKVVAKPGTTYRDIVKDKSQIKAIQQQSDDGGRTWFGLLPPVSVSSSRLKVAYAEDGGDTADGVIFLRPGVKDLDLGGANYAQVRIAVDGTHFIKGMAMYKDDLPKGVDMVFNTNKKRGTPVLGDKDNSVLKPLKSDPDNPFGSIVRQIGDRDETGRITKVTSAMNIVNEAGDWTKWSATLSSQMLSKQSPKLAREQLDKAYQKKKEDLDEIMALTNPVVKQKLLASYADGADSAAVHLKAAAMPRQANHVILPINTLKETEVYAPGYRHGERVVLIRHPHGGTFEIPELTVNLRHADAKKALGNAPDAIGINSEVAKRLSGADFDGDTVLVIPNNTGSIKTSPSLQGLKDFDPQRAYPPYEGMPKMKPSTKQKEMGVVSNLITDMTIKGASHDELAAAVRHSMVVIDAEKHNLNYKQSAIDNGIRNLQKKYQPDGGASTIISRARSQTDVVKRKLRSPADGGPIDPKTGKLVYEKVGKEFVDKKGNLRVETQRSKKLAETDDAHSLSSGMPVEKIYADHSNRLKGLANQARLELVKTKPFRTNASAKEIYKKEVQELNAALNLSFSNKPRERIAQVIAKAQFDARLKANPEMDPAEIKKVKFQVLREARRRSGADKYVIEISDRQWEAIQAGAISPNRLRDILDNANLEQVKKLATPKPERAISSTQVRKAEALARAGRTQSEIADILGIPLGTLKKYINQ